MLLQMLTAGCGTWATSQDRWSTSALGGKSSRAGAVGTP